MAKTVAIGIFCKTPAPGLSKTRLSPPLRPEECAALSACFIRDLAGTVLQDKDVVHTYTFRDGLVVAMRPSP